MADIPEELINLLVEEGVDYIAGRIGETALDNSVLYQAFHFLITKGVEFVLPTVLSASFGDPSAFALGLIKRDISKIQKDLDQFREIPFYTIKHLVEEAKDDIEDEVNHCDAYEKFKAIERKALKAIFSSKIFEHKIQAAEIAVLAKSYLKRYDMDSSTFLELHAVDEAKKRSLARQIQRLLNQFVSMPEYIDAVEKAKGAWYRTEKAAKESHRFVDRVDALKVTVYANSVLCLNTIAPAKLHQEEEDPFLSKSWNLKRNWIPEGERFALEISLSEQEISEILTESEEVTEEIEDDIDDGYTTTEEEEEDGEDDTDDENHSENDNDNWDMFSEGSEDEQLSDDEDVNDEGDETDFEGDDEEDVECHIDSCSIEQLGTSVSPFRVYTDLFGTVFIKTGMKCRLHINGEDQETNESEKVQNCWRIENPDDHLKMEFFVTKEEIESRSILTCKKLNLTEEAGNSLRDLLSGSDTKSLERAESFLKTGTVTNISWRIHWSEILRSLDTGKDLQSPLFTPLPVDDTQPHMRAIIDGGKNKIGVKKVSWRGKQTSLVAGMMMWIEENPEVNVVGYLKTIKKKVKDLQVKNVNWEDFGDAEFIRVEIFLFSSLSCEVE